MNLGRIQVGQVVTLGLSTFDPSGAPTAPESAPVATITNPNGTKRPPFKLAMNGGPLAFALPILLGLDFSLGIYGVSYTYTANGFVRSGWDAFTVIAGGDPGGAIISMASYERPEAQYVVVQLTSGRIVQGRNPKL